MVTAHMITSTPIIIPITGEYATFLIGYEYMCFINKPFHNSNIRGRFVFLSHLYFFNIVSSMPVIQLLFEPFYFLLKVTVILGIAFSGIVVTDGKKRDQVMLLVRLEGGD
jgi:hypothetical protein